MHCALAVHLITSATMQLPASMVGIWSPAIIGLGTAWWRPVVWAHIGVEVEVGNNLSRDHSKTRPADVLLPNWVLGRTAALDVSITSPLNPVTLLEAGVSACCPGH